MKKCRYFSDDSQPPLATPEQRNKLLMAVQKRQVEVVGTALRHVTGVWRITPDEFIEAIEDHLETGRMVFQKFEKGRSVLLPNMFDASVWIREPDDEDDYDDGTVYVEFRIRNDKVILICNSHEHERNRRRLPR